MALADEPPMKENGDAQESGSALPQESCPANHSSPSSSSNSSSDSKPSSGNLSVRESGAANDASPISIATDTGPRSCDSRPHAGSYGSYGSSESTALSYFAPTGAGRLTFVPPAGVSSQRGIRIHPHQGDSRNGESVRYYTLSGEARPEPPPWSLSAQASQSLQHGPAAGDLGLVYYSSPSGSYAPAQRSPASSVRLPGQQPFIASSTIYARALPCHSDRRQQQAAPAPAHVLPGCFVPASACFANPVAPQQRATGNRGTVLERWTFQQQRNAGVPAGLDSRGLAQQQTQQDVGSCLNAQKQEPRAGMPVAFVVGTPQHSPYYVNEVGVTPSMKGPQPYTATPLLLQTEKHRSAATGASTGQQEPEALQSYPLQQALHMLRRQSPRTPGRQWVEQSLPPYLPRERHDGSGRRRGRAIWDCYEDLASPRDLLPILSGSRVRISRSLRENLHSRRKEFSRMMQQLQNSVSRCCQRLTQNISDYHRRSGDVLRWAEQQSSAGDELVKVVSEDRYVPPSYPAGSSAYAVILQPQGRSGDVKERETAQLVSKDGRIFYGPPATPLFVESDTAAKPVAGVQRTDGYPLQQVWQVPRREEVLDIVPVGSTRGVDGNFYISSEYPRTTRPCPTCGGTQVLVFADPSVLAAARTAAKDADIREGALQRCAAGDVGGCLQRLGEWRCALCSSVGEVVDDELLHTGGVVQQSGEWVDEVFALVVRGVAETLRSFFLMIPRPSPHVVEGYPLYEPDYTYMTRKGRPTSLTGNFCIDQLNAFLDACLVGEDDVHKTLPKAPPVPPTTRTGNWLIDAANAAFDKLLAEDGGHGRYVYAVSRKTDRETDATTTTSVCTRLARVCPMLDICSPRTPRAGDECPQCHQPLRSGVCPVDAARERRRKGLFDACLAPERQDVVQQPTPHYAYEASPVVSLTWHLELQYRPAYVATDAAVPAMRVSAVLDAVGYYVPSGPKEPGADQCTPAYGASLYDTAVEKPTQGRVYYTPVATAAETKTKVPEWPTPEARGSSDALIPCQYPYAPIYATQPCSEGFTVAAGARRASYTERPAPPSRSSETVRLAALVILRVYIWRLHRDPLERGVLPLCE